MAKREQSTFERLNDKNLNRKQRRELHRQLFSDDPGLDILHPDAAGIDIGNGSHFVSVPPDRDPKPVQEFGSWTADLERMATWVKSCGVKTVAMQATGVYWFAAHDVLEKHGLEVFVVNARDTRNLPGRKTDVQESQWLRKLHTYGLLRNSFMPPDEIRAVRTTWRVRDRLVQDASRYVQHMQKALTTMNALSTLAPNVQLANVVSDINGVTGQTIIRTILNGEGDIYVLADLRDPRVKASREMGFQLLPQEIARSLEGNWREDVLFELKQAVDAYDFVQKQMAECDKRLEKYMAALPSRTFDARVESALPGSGTQKAENADKKNGGKKKRKDKKPKGNQPHFDLRTELQRVNGVDLTAIEGIDVMTAQTILSEIGVDMSRWKNENHFVSWAGLTPNKDVSGGKVIRHKSKRVKNRVGNALRMAANALHHSESYLGARFRKLKARRGAPKAIKGMARYLGCLVHRLLTHGQAWVDRGTREFEAKCRQREIDELMRKAAELGIPLAAPTA